MVDYWESDDDLWFADRDATAAAAFILNFPALAHESLIENGMEGQYFSGLHQASILNSLMCDRPDLVPLTRNLLTPAAAEALPGFCRFMEAQGFLVGMEREFIRQCVPPPMKERRLVQWVKEQLFFDVRDFTAAGRVVSFPSALAEMQDFLQAGGRNVLAIGTYDFGTRAQQTVITDYFRQLVLKFGKLTVLVPGNAEVGIVKGALRPYMDLEWRMQFVSRIPGVHIVAPVFFPGATTRSELELRYQQLHYDLAPLVHFRAIGEGPTDAEIYPMVLSQCRAAGIPLIHPNYPRMDSATRQLQMHHLI